MIVASWNVRGLNDLNKVVEVRHFAANNNIDMACLLETRVRENNFEKVKKKIGLRWTWHSNYQFSHKGRIWVGVNSNKLNFTVTFTSAQVISGMVTDIEVGEVTNVAFVYGLHNVGDRKGLWMELESVCAQWQGPGIIIGDLNTVFDPTHRG